MVEAPSASPARHQSGIRLAAGHGVSAENAHEAPAPAQEELPQRRHRRSYSGLHGCRAEVRLPHRVEDLAATLAEARTQGRRVTLAGAGLSFDAQALGADVIVSTARLDHIEVDPERAVVRVGPGARWHDIVRATSTRGFLTPVMVSSGDTTAGGTVGTNGLSRFSPVFGKEGCWVRAVRLLLSDGTEVRASRDEHPELFFAAVGGLGLVGVITEVEYELLAVDTPLRVESWVERRPALEGLAEALVFTPERDVSAQTAYAVLVADGDALRVLLTRSRYVAGVPLKRMLPHRPDSPMRVPIELAIQNLKGAGQRFWRFAYDHYVREDRPYVDDLEGYTFFMDGNVRTRRFARRLRLPFRAAQQTFVLPSAGGDEALLPFLRACHRRVRDSRLSLAMFDVLHLPEDEPFALSSTRGQAGFAVTLTLDGTLRDADMYRVERLLGGLSALALRLGGRVHLTKNVFASSDTVAAMYRDGLRELAELRKRYDPQGVLTSDFARRRLPSLCR